MIEASPRDLVASAFRRKATAGSRDWGIGTKAGRNEHHPGNYSGVAAQRRGDDVRHRLGLRRHAVADMEIGFADFLIESWRFMFRIEGNSVIVVSGNVSPGSPTENLGTFSDFLKVYITSPDALRIL